MYAVPKSCQRTDSLHENPAGLGSGPAFLRARHLRRNRLWIALAKIPTARPSSLRPQSLIRRITLISVALWTRRTHASCTASYAAHNISTIDGQPRPADLQ